LPYTPGAEGAGRVVAVGRAPDHALRLVEGATYPAHSLRSARYCTASALARVRPARVGGPRVAALGFSPCHPCRRSFPSTPSCPTPSTPG
jgi:hypothetical protein